jgi:hypothetical protein
MNFFSIILFWPTESYNVYGHDAKQVGVRNLALGFPILAGACIVLVLLSWTRGRIRELMLVSCILMTLGKLHKADILRLVPRVHLMVSIALQFTCKPVTRLIG